MTMSEMLDCAEQTLTSLRSSFKSFLDSGGSAVLMFVSVQFLQLES